MQELDLQSGLDFSESNANDAAFCLAASVLSKEVFERFLAIISASRDKNTTPAIFPQARPAQAHADAARAAFFENKTKQSTKHVALSTYVSRLSEYHFAKEMVEAKGTRERCSTSFLNQVLGHMGSSQTTDARRSLSSLMARGRKWMVICESPSLSRGLLALIPYASDDTVRKMSLDKVAAFTAYLERQPHTRRLIQKLCGLGTLIERFVCKGELKFQFELDTSIAADQPLSIEMFKQDRYLRENKYSTEHDWAEAPQGWNGTGQWIQPGCQRTRKAAPCAISPTTATVPRKSAQATTAASSIVFQKPIPTAITRSEYIGEFTGELLPVDAAVEYGIVLEICRPDALFAPAVCLLQCGKAGNWTRLVNHSCHPCAEIVTQVISGRVRVMLRALVDIQDGMEITIGYGRDNFKSTNCACAKCAE
ncbi:hypothetical protein P153DRAFT_382796 [Dothidotthia symphoricarpi CBS 119687]|uniref:SET domain-containing protein n=1 Tax=Dothidotthia symphoricarpi CBS 119687 TaxID=1392245 RepID=A0A6A6AK27_9PLEO|nr:uncharacterized protein P153DRAFT_382796 [Dothidotthia symphoricarpi CBS 119687]KAF2131906.1 hypothetical protein P153DRAFT_382796 [Dothidotthia symphoricarpi CBS 119687]